MRKTERKSLEAVRKSLMKEIERIDAFTDKVAEMKKPHAFALGYLEGMKTRRCDARESLRAVERAIADLENGAASKPGKPLADKGAKRSPPPISH